MSEEFLKKLRNLVRETPKNISFPLVIETLFSKKVLQFNNEEPINQELLNKLSTAATEVCEQVAKAGGIKKERANEAGNNLESFVESALKSVGFAGVCSPMGATGKKQVNGYPDLEFTHQGRAIYVEVKTYGKGKEKDSLRTFYFSPSETFKVTKDAFHILTAFETTNIKGCRYISGWKITPLDKITVNIKYEFHTNNRELYKTEATVIENNFDYEDFS